MRREYGTPTNETGAASHIVLSAANNGTILYRNNVGACETTDGRQIRYGLCNESKQLNDRIKSSDYIGITPVLIGPQHLGTLMGVFTAVETKKPGWHMTPSDKRAIAQAAFHDIVRQAGGYAGFAQSVEDFMRIIGRGT